MSTALLNKTEKTRQKALERLRSIARIEASGEKVDNKTAAEFPRLLHESGMQAGDYASCGTCQ